MRGARLPGLTCSTQCGFCRRCHGGSPPPAPQRSSTGHVAGTDGCAQQRAQACQHAGRPRDHVHESAYDSCHVAYPMRSSQSGLTENIHSEGENGSAYATPRLCEEWSRPVHYSAQVSPILEEFPAWMDYRHMTRTVQSPHDSNCSNVQPFPSLCHSLTCKHMRTNVLPSRNFTDIAVCSEERGSQVRVDFNTCARVHAWACIHMCVLT
jgi:hypothetical protein